VAEQGGRSLGSVIDAQSLPMMLETAAAEAISVQETTW